MMKNTFMALLFVCVVYSIQAQEVYFYSGKNFTAYDFKNSSGNSNSNLKNGTGTFYEVGYNKKIKQDRFSYSLALALNEYNNTGGNTVNNYQWNTYYLGIQTHLYYSYFKGKNYDLLSTIGLNPSTLLSGKQQINGFYYDLTKEKEFTGLLVSPSIGLQFKYNVSNFGYVSFGYNYVKSYSLSNNTNQKLGFTTNQIQFGVHFELKSEKLQQPVVSEKEPFNNTSTAIIPKEATISNDKQNLTVVVEENVTKGTNVKEKIKEETEPLYNNEVPFTTNLSAFNFSAKGLSILELDTNLIHKTIDYLIKNPNKILVLNGYSSNDGSNSENIRLSLKRAYVAKEYFILNGVPETRIETYGRGGTNPKYSNTSVEGRLKNKRVEIEFK
jgi:outer membrane protein OmpA-like peptidoglycan-associated protein